MTRGPGSKLGSRSSSHTYVTSSLWASPAARTTLTAHKPASQLTPLTFSHAFDYDVFLWIPVEPLPLPRYDKAGDQDPAWV